MRGGTGDVPRPRPGDRRRRRVRTAGRTALAVGAVVVLAAAAFALANREIIGDYLAHRVGGPPQTWEPVDLPPEAQPQLRVALVGDVGDGGARADAVAAAIEDQSANDRYDILMLLGDNVYPSGDPDRIEETVFGPFGPVLDRGTDLFAILGNHDDTEGTGDAQLEALGMPDRWYAVRRGDVLGIALDSTDPTNPEQLAWLEETLAATDAPWRMVGLHHPPYSSGLHGSSTQVREAFVPIFERYGVQIVFSGHEHDYQRTDPIDGITYVVSGAGSRTRRTGVDDFTAVAWSTHHYIDLNVYADRVLLRAIDQDGDQFDEAVIPRSIPPPPGEG